MESIPVSRVNMSETFLVRVYPNGAISSEGLHGVSFRSDRTIPIKIRRDTSINELRQLIHQKLKLPQNQEVSHLIYRIPECMNPLIYNTLPLSDDEDVEAMVDCHAQFKGILSSMELYAKIETNNNNNNIAL